MSLWGSGGDRQGGPAICSPRATSSWRRVQAASFKWWIKNPTERPNHLPSSRTHDITLLRRTWIFKLFSLCFPSNKLTLSAGKWKKQECSAIIFLMLFRDITLPTKVHMVKARVFPVVMYRCEIWTITRAERWKIDAFELWCWRRLLRVPWAARISKLSIVNKISPEYSLEGLMLKLKLQSFGHLMQRAESLKKDWC